MAQLLNKLPPQNLEAEQSVLGALMLDQSAITKVADTLRPEDFYKQTHQMIFRAMLDLYQKNEPIDLVNLTNRLSGLKGLEEVGGPAYLAGLANSVPAATHVTHYAKIVREKRTLRDLIDASSYILGLGYREDAEVEALVDEAEQRIFRISQRSTTKDFLAVESLLQDSFTRIDRLNEDKNALRGIPTGFKDIDRLLSGLQRSDLIILAARPSMGKSTLALDIARRAAQKNYSVGVFSLEMSKDQLVDRLLASQAEVDLWRLRTGQLAEDDFHRLPEAFGTLAKLPIFIDDSGSSTILEMRTLARRLQAERGLDLLIVDYLQLMQTRGRIENRVQEISEISRSLKALARELNIPVLALSQLSRGVEHRPDHRPKLADLRDSGSIEQDSDVVMFIYREDTYKPANERTNAATILIEKHRNGPTGEVGLYFDGAHVKFDDLASEREAGASFAPVPVESKPGLPDDLPNIALEEDIFA